MTLWADPQDHIWVSNEYPSASNLNFYVKDPLRDLHRRTTTSSAHVGTTASPIVETFDWTAYAPLPNSCAVAVQIGSSGLALITLSANLENDTADCTCYLGMGTSGTYTLPPDDAQSFAFTSPVVNGGIRSGVTFPLGGMPEGPTTFYTHVRVGPSVGAHGIGTIRIRRISCTPLGS